MIAGVGGGGGTSSWNYKKLNTAKALSVNISQ